jgi:hypothetical protein
MFHAVFERQARRSFDLVNQHDYDSVLATVTPDIHHRFSGDHALAGDRHDAAHLRLWFERLHRLMAGLTLTVTDVWVVGGLRRTTVIVRWKRRRRSSTVSRTTITGCTSSSSGTARPSASRSTKTPRQSSAVWSGRPGQG